MNIRDVLFNDAMALESVSAKGMCGGTYKPTQRIGDLENTISLSSASAYMAKDYFKESFPYSLLTVTFDTFDPYTNPEFATKLLQHLSYEYSFSDFSAAEEQFYKEYREYQLGIIKTGDMLLALEVLDTWLITEVEEGIHSDIRPTYQGTYTSAYINLHFLLELRRQLSGVIADGTSTFSSSEIQFYLDYQEFTAGVVKRGNVLIAVKELDNWLLKELAGEAHPMLERDYSTTHKWRKTLTR